MSEFSVGLGYVEHLSYLGVFLIIIFSGYLLPIPEEIILLAIGYVGAEGIGKLHILIPLCILACLIGDTLFYYLSFRGSRYTRKLLGRLSKRRLERYLMHEKLHTGAVIFFSRFIVGMRFLNPLISGFIKVPWKIFVPFTVLSAALYVPLVVGIGYYFHNTILNAVTVVAEVRHTLFIMILILAASLMSIYIHRWFYNRG